MQKVNVFCVNKTNPYATIYILNKKKKRTLEENSIDVPTMKNTMNLLWGVFCVCVCMYLLSLINIYIVYIPI